MGIAGGMARAMVMEGGGLPTHLIVKIDPMHRTPSTIKTDAPPHGAPISPPEDSPHGGGGRPSIRARAHLVSRSTDSPLLFAACDVDRTSVAPRAVSVFFITAPCPVLTLSCLIFLGIDQIGIHRGPGLGSRPWGAF